MTEPYRGPTVYEAAEALIAKNRRLIEDLQEEIYAAQYRLRRLSYANMLEAERVATEAEKLMMKPLDTPVVVL